MTDLRTLYQRFKPGQRAPGAIKNRGGPIFDPPTLDGSSGNPDMLAQQILSAHARALGEPAPQFEPGPTQVHGVPREFRPAADLADDIVDAYDRARREQGDADNGDEDEDDGGKKKPRDDDQPEDDRPDQRRVRGPDQTREMMTADGIIAAMKRAAGEL
jgi:hypothetical protein